MPYFIFLHAKDLLLWLRFRLSSAGRPVKWVEYHLGLQDCDIIAYKMLLVYFGRFWFAFGLQNSNFGYSTTSRGLQINAGRKDLD